MYPNAEFFDYSVGQRAPQTPSKVNQLFEPLIYSFYTSKGGFLKDEGFGMKNEG